MSVFDEIDPSVLYTERGASRSKTGFLGSFSRAYDDQVRGWGVLSLERNLQEQETRQLDAIEKATGSRPDLSDAFAAIDAAMRGEEPQDVPSDFTDDPSLYLRMAKYFEGQAEGDESAIAEIIAKREARYGDLKGKFPGFKTYKQLWQDAKAQAKRAEDVWNRTETTNRGMIGGFLGGAAGSLNPVTDPFNFASIGVGGVGKTAFVRIATEGAAQGLVETINQFTGVQENRELMGLPYGLGQAAQQIGLTAAFGAGIRGAGEGIVAGVRGLRGMPDAPPEPPPPPHPVPRGVADVAEEGAAAIRDMQPYGPSRFAGPRAAADEAEVARQLESLNGPAPKDVKPIGPRTLDEMWRAVDDDIPHWWPEDIRGPARADRREWLLRHAIRQSDPDLFRKFERIEARLGDARNSIFETLKELETERFRDIDATIARAEQGLEAAQRELISIDAELARLEAIDTSAMRPAARRQIERRIEAFQTRRGPAERDYEARRRELEPDVATLRRYEELQEVLAARREEIPDLVRQHNELGPLVQRAEGRVRGEYAGIEPNPPRAPSTYPALLLRPEDAFGGRGGLSPENALGRSGPDLPARPEAPVEVPGPIVPPAPRSAKEMITALFKGRKGTARLTHDEAQHVVDAAMPGHLYSTFDVQAIAGRQLEGKRVWEISDPDGKVVAHGEGQPTVGAFRDIAKNLKGPASPLPGVTPPVAAPVPAMHAVAGAPAPLTKTGAEHLRDTLPKVADELDKADTDRLLSLMATIDRLRNADPATATADDKLIDLGDGFRLRLDEEIPAEVIRDEKGEVIEVKTRTIRAELLELANDHNMLTAMTTCAIP